MDNIASRDQTVLLLNSTEPSLFPNPSGASSVMLQESTSSSPPDSANFVPTITQPSMATNSDNSRSSNDSNEALESNNEDSYHSNVDQNIIEQMSIEEAEGPDPQLSQQCQICYNEQINTLLLPCGHAKMCEACARQIINIQKKPCPYSQIPVIIINFTK